MKKCTGFLFVTLLCCVYVVGCEDGQQMIGTVLAPPTEVQPPAEVQPSTEVQPPAEVCLIPDPNLAAAVRETLGLTTDASLTAEVLQNLKDLEAYDRQITDLTGLECAVNLTRMYLGNSYNSDTPNQVSDISPLENLTHLTYLALGSNKVSDISPLENLTHLTELRLSDNKVSDISPLENLTHLTQLALVHNQISDISPLENLNNLIDLIVGVNQISDISPLENLNNLTLLSLDNNYLISDISPLKNLNNLTGLHLSYNQISDIASLVANTGLDSGDHITLWGNPLNEASIKTHILALESRGVKVDWSP